MRGGGWVRAGMEVGVGVVRCPQVVGQTSRLQSVFRTGVFPSQVIVAKKYNWKGYY